MEINSKTCKTTRQIDERAGKTYLEGYEKTLSEAIQEGDLSLIFCESNKEKQPRKKFRYRYELEPVFGKPLSEAVREGNFFLICHEAEEEKQQSGLLEE